MSAPDAAPLADLAGQWTVAPELLATVLRPYKPHCRYLRSATVHAPAEIRGELSIPSSCYIDDTGHFNSVEFNLCYNQLVYALMAQVVVAKLLPAFATWTIDDYLRRQLSDVLIHDFASKFHRPMHTDRFFGRVAITHAAPRKRFLLVQSEVAFEDGRGGSSHGAVTLAIVERGAGGE